MSVSPVTTHLSDPCTVRTKLMCRAESLKQSHRYSRTFSHMNILNFSASIASVDWNKVITPYCSPEEMSIAIMNIIIGK